MSDAEMVSREIPFVPETLEGIRVWLEKILRNHFMDIKRIYNNQIAGSSIELVKSGNEPLEEGNWLFTISGDDLEIQRHDGSDWVDTGWKLKGS